MKHFERGEESIPVKVDFNAITNIKNIHKQCKGNNLFE